MHCSLLLSAWGNSPAAAIAWSYSPIPAYIAISSFSVTALPGELRRLLYIPIARRDWPCSDCATRDDSSPGATANCAPQFEHCENRCRPDTGNSGMKNSVNQWRTVLPTMSACRPQLGHTVLTGRASASSETTGRVPNKRMKPLRVIVPRSNTPLQRPGANGTPFAIPLACVRQHFDAERRRIMCWRKATMTVLVGSLALGP